MGKNFSAFMLYFLMLLYASSTTIVGTVLAELLADFQLDMSQGGIFTLAQYIGSSMLLFLSISAGQVVFPWLMGHVGKIGGLSASILFNVACLGLSMITAFVLSFSLAKTKKA